MKHWIVVVSKDHISRGISGGFIQANHGKLAPLKRMAVGDWVAVYSPKQKMNGDEPLQAFTAIGQVRDEDIYQKQMAIDFTPYRRNVNYYECAEAPIAPMIGELDFITNKKAWGYNFRFGFFEVPGADFEKIKEQMITEDKPLLNKATLWKN
ncbi:EVE domain-containing protein [Mucilaginibacter rubeus]|uniref:UPF0310 protein DEO27_014270 n=1 Tax=Mucilaginibacter rubeus TaxID=2027860 RepID=A0A5C1HZ80_9SPHI|nr:EVE domain-containing protein [Mucilaginibacter rubeus]QEM11136.1 EVE domain-containing protein [Mucilaginibacter rubeus]